MKPICRLLFAMIAVVVAVVAPLPAVTPAPPAATRPAGEQVDVVPVFFVPVGGPMPSAEQIAKLRKHLEWSRDRYAELLPGKITFKLADGPPLIYRAKRGISYYRLQPGSGIPRMMSELLVHQKFTPQTCPHIYATVVMNSKNEFPKPAGQPFNGGFNTGGGGLAMSSKTLDWSVNIQSTLQHELGHTFGLPHVDTYGMDMKTSPSLMSYNPGHHTAQFVPSKTPGILIPEDLRGLSLNERVFPGLSNQPMPLPPGYELKPLVKLGAMAFDR